MHVADEGRGLRPGDQEHIFGTLTRSDKDADAVAGIGLGLSLCHGIVTRHSGWIRAENNEWGGATFLFTMPAEGSWIEWPIGCSRGAQASSSPP